MFKGVDLAKLEGAAGRFSRSLAVRGRYSRLKEQNLMAEGLGHV